MSDYLFNLVDGALGTALVIAPRLRSMHEPPSPRAEPLPGEFATTDDAEMPPRHADATRHRLARAQRVSAEQPGFAPSAQSAAGAQHRRGADVDDDALLVPSPATLRMAPPPDQAAPTSLPAPSNEKTEDCSTAVARATDPGKSVRPVTEDARKPASSMREVDRDRAAVASAARNDASADSPAPPEVHITIGRVDVRAVFAPSPAPPARKSPSPPSSRLTLEEYMRQSRTRGAR